MLKFTSNLGSLNVEEMLKVTNGLGSLKLE